MGGCFGCTDTIEDDIVSYLEECKRDPKLHESYIMLHENTIQAATALDTSNKTPDWSQFFHLLVSVHESVLRISTGVVESITEGRRDASNADFYDLVNLYLDSSNKILGFRNALRSWVEKARVKSRFIEEALAQFGGKEDEDETGSKEATLRRYQNTKEQLENFMAAEDPIDADFVQLLKSMIKEQKDLLQALREQKKKSSRELANARGSKILWNVIFGTAIASIVIIGYVVLTLPVSPVATAPIVTVVFGLASSSLNAAKKIRDGWTEYEEEVKKRLSSVEEMIFSENIGTRTYLQDIQHLVDGLRKSIDDITRNAEIAVRLDDQEATWRNAMVGIKDAFSLFNEDIDKLETHTENSFDRIMSERDKIRNHLLNHHRPSNDNSSAVERFDCCGLFDLCSTRH